MKKIFLTLGAALAFGMAQAQTQHTSAPKKEPVTTQVKEKTMKDAEGVQPATQVNTTEPLAKDAVTPKEDVTADHVKTTSSAKTVKDSTTSKKVRKTKRN